MDRQIDWPYKWWENAGKEIDFLYVMYGILRNSTLRETNKYIFELFKKKFNTGRETHKFLIIVDNTSKARVKRQRGKKNLK